jgi:hypothetical protein
MTLSIESRIEGGRVRFDVRGPWNLGDIFALIGRVREEADAAGLDAALVDLLDVPGPIPQMERFFAGKRVAEVLKHRIRLAVVARAEYIDKFGENTAVNRGARMAVMSSEDHALAWLDGPD